MQRSRWVPFPETAEAFIRSIVAPDHPLTGREVSAILGVHPNTVKHIPAGQLPYFTFGERRDRRYLSCDLRAYVRERSVNS